MWNKHQCACIWVLSAACPGLMYTWRATSYPQATTACQDHENDTRTHTRARTHAPKTGNISGPAGAIYLSLSRFKILIKINLPQFSHSTICLFIRIMLIVSVGAPRIIAHFECLISFNVGAPSCFAYGCRDIFSACGEQARRIWTMWPGPRPQPPTTPPSWSSHKQ